MDRLPRHQGVGAVGVAHHTSFDPGRGEGVAERADLAVELGFGVRLQQELPAEGQHVIVHQGPVLSRVLLRRHAGAEALTGIELKPRHLSGCHGARAGAEGEVRRPRLADDAGHARGEVGHCTVRDEAFEVRQVGLFEVGPRETGHADHHDAPFVDCAIGRCPGHRRAEQQQKDDAGEEGGGTRHVSASAGRVRTVR